MIYTTRPRGFTLLIAVILTTVVLTVGLALLDVAYKQVILASTARQSQYAFYAADSGLECALYWDQQQDTFNYSTESLSGTISCEGQSFPYTAPPAAGGTRVTTFSVPCAGGGGNNANVTIYKDSSGGTKLYSNGFNLCDSTNPRRVERGVKASY